MGTEQQSEATNRSPAGLCAGCSYSREIISDRRATFYLCERANTDPAFHKYPRLPVLQCSGYEPKK